MIDRIDAEVLQRFTAGQAREYMLVPYATDGAALKCYGVRGRDYSDALQELEVLHGVKAAVEMVEASELEKLLKAHYRSEGVESRSPARPTTDIGSGRGFLIGMIEQAFDCYASDIHIESYERRCRVRFRMDGKLIERYVIEKGNYASLVNQIKILANLDIAERRLPQDGRILFEQGGKKFDVRVSCLPAMYGEKVVLRLLTRHAELLELDNLGFTARQLEDYCRQISRPHGMALICGSTGSGKTTTLYATLRRLNRESDNILTIEDPIEYTLEGVNQVQLREEIGLTFTSALRTFLRQDPDVIMLGEIRDADTAQMAIRSSLTGHLILSTIHTNSAWGAVSRLTDMGVHPYLIADTLALCVAQRLVRLLCPHCRREEEATDGIMALAPVERHYSPEGCAKCYYTGFSGRRAIYEVIPMDARLARAAREGQTDVVALLAERGISTLRDAALALFASGQTSLSEIIPMLNG